MQTPTSSRLFAAVVFVAAATAITVEADVDAITRAAAKTTSKIVNVDFNHEFPLLSAVSSWQRKHFGSSPASSRAVSPPDHRRSLVETSFCEFDAEDNDCDINPLAVFQSFRPATSAGQILVEVFKPELECRQLMSKTTCSANPSCEFEDKKCGFNPVVLLSAKVGTCKDSEKANVTILTKILEGNATCTVAKDKASCSDRISAGCIFEDGICQFDSKRYIGEYMMADMGAGSMLGMFVKLGKLVDVCEMTSSGATTNATTACNANSKCEWDITKKNCDVSAPARNAILSAGNTSAVTAIYVQAFTCSLSSPTSCIAPCAKSLADTCVYPASEIALSLFGEMKESPMKDIMMKTVTCSLVDISTSMNTTAAESSCKAAAEGCSYTMGAAECDFNPDATDIMNLMKAKIPGSQPQCPTLMSMMIPSVLECIATPEAECGTGATAGKCEMDEGSCSIDESIMFELLLGKEDGQNVASMMSSCEQHSSKAACEVQTMDLDFFGKKNPTKQKVETVMSFKGITVVNPGKIKTALAATIGGDVKVEDITLTKIHFPVKAKLRLSTTLATVNADKPAFESKFKKGAAVDLMVSESDIVISAITESARRRGRGLLAAGVDVAFTVENAADATVAQRIATNITTASALTTLAAETGATATVVEAPTFELVVAMEIATADSAGVTSKVSESSTTATLATNLATAGMASITVTVTETPTVKKNSYLAPASASSGHRSFQTLTGGVAVAIFVVGMIVF